MIYKIYCICCGQDFQQEKRTKIFCYSCNKQKLLRISNKTKNVKKIKRDIIPKEIKYKGLFKFLKNKGWSYGELGRRIGYTSPQICNIMRGKAKFHKKKYEKLLKLMME